ncbi:MAG: hypothetical protein HOE69_03235 [Euryarchaeota archaeon]|jgi:tRNA (guanine26-N2/guanine27-N2)-dimethyltransferase|nr:hypothetical protein [Euryarchaeota archaeon]
MSEEWPEGWPGEIAIEGRTEIHLPNNLSGGEANNAGPGVKGEREVFHNHAMAGNRTRSVLLMAHEMSEGSLNGEKPVRMLDSLAATGVRSHRLCHELPTKLAARLQLYCCDMNDVAIEWLEANHRANPPAAIGEFKPVCGDARQVALSRGWQWVDIDPFGSPIPFLDSVMQSLARRAILEVTATDVAALTGSSPAPLMRRYGARAKLDEIAHDTGLRILLATIARCAARHDRVIEPLISTWDSHHLRVSVRVRKSLDSASNIEQHIGWRISEPTEQETGDDFGHEHALVPLSVPVSTLDKRISGPLWIGQIGDQDVMASMTEERALKLCGPTEQMVEDESELRLRRRAIAKAVRHIADEAKAIHSGNLVVVDALASRLSLPEPPSPAKLVAAISEIGYAAAIAAYGKPAIRTDAPFAAILTALKNC